MGQPIYGWDKPDDRTLRLSLARAPRTWRKFRHQAGQDHGRHHTTWAISGHAGPWGESDIAWQAARLNQPPAVFAAEPAAGPLGQSFSLLAVDDPAVAVRA